MNRWALSTLAASAIWLTPGQAFAYLGPGAGLSAIGVILAVLTAVLIAVFGFLWYPLKRMRRKRREKAALAARQSDETADSERK